MEFDQYVAARRVPLLRGAVLLGVRESEAPALVDRLLLELAGRIERRADPDALTYAALAELSPETPAPAPVDEGPGFAVRRTLARWVREDRALAVLLLHGDLMPHEAADALALRVGDVGAREASLVSALEARDPLHARDLLAHAAATVGVPPLSPLARPAPSRLRPLAAVTAGVAVVAVAAGVAWAQHSPAPLEGELGDDQVPSVFGYRVGHATDILEERGLRVQEQMAPSCDPVGVVVGTDPPTGARVERGETVTVLSAFPSGYYCEARYAERSDAWDFLSFAAGQGPAPTFAEEVTVVVDASAPVTLTGAEAADRTRWGDPSVLTAITDGLGEVYDVPGSSSYRTPELAVRTERPPRSTCGVPRPRAFEGREALVLTVALRGSETSLCPLTVDLYRQGPAIDGVVLHTAGGPAR